VTNTREKQFKGGKIYFGSQFQRFQFKVTGSIALDPRAVKIPWWQEHVCHDSQEAEKEKRKDKGQDMPFQGMPQ
jgi:hypothetical protein